MPSHLTRHVFRRILANEPIVHRECLRRQAHTAARRLSAPTRAAAAHNGTQTIRQPQRRTFFNFNMFRGKKREAKEADYAPGIEDMMHLAKMQRMRARLPPPKDIAEAFTSFFDAKCKQKHGINDTEAKLVLQSWNYLQAAGLEAASHANFNPLRRAALTLKRSVKSATDAHLELVRAMYEAAYSRYGIKALCSRDCALAYVRLLGSLGHSQKAREFALDTEKAALSKSSEEAELDQETDDLSGPTQDRQFGNGSRDSFLTILWCEVLSGFAKGDSEQELLSTLDMMRSRAWLRPHTLLQQSMFQFYLNTNDLQAAKKWFTDLWDQHTKAYSADKVDASDMAQDLHDMLRWCLLKGELEYGHQVVRQTMTDNPPKEVWDAIFVWAAGTGKGADEIARMLDVMEASNEDIPDPSQWRLPDIATVNGLVGYATSKGDPYLAERFISLGQSRGIEPDAKTYQLQMEYRLKINDVDGALIAYKNLQAMDVSTEDDVPTVNKLIVALCQSRRHDFDTVMNVAMDLSDRRAQFEPETVATLALLHLSRDEVHDTVDLLNTHAHHYSSTERESIRDKVLAFCLDPKNSTSRSWDAYSIIVRIFDETTRLMRTEIMTNFFRRERPDMALHCFNEMRRHSREDTIPTLETYVTAFLGSARLRDSESLELIHNQLKLDYNIDVNTYLNNTLIIAYTACKAPRKALTFWDDIVLSKEGPTYNSIHIALRACEKAPFGDVKAKCIWEKLRTMNVELDQSMWASYVSALVGNGANELAISTVEEAESKEELEVDAFLIGSMVNTAQNQAKQEEIIAWAKERYSAVWEDLQKIGSEEDDVGRLTYNIDRSVTP